MSKAPKYWAKAKKILSKRDKVMKKLIANLLLTQSYRLAEASLVTPIKYLSLVFAIIFGYFIWSEVPKILTLLGAALVIASSLIIFMRENKLKKQIIAPRT